MFTKKRTYLTLFILWLTHILANFVWLKVDTRPPFWDTAGHAISALQVARLPFATDFPTAFQGVLAIGPYPPLIHLASAPLALLFWPTVDTLLGVNALFLGILLLSTYGIATAFAGRKAGLLAAFVVSMYPMIYGLTRHYLLDIPLVAMVALAVWLLVRTEDFQRRGPAILYGLSLAFGMLTKWTFAVFILGPFLASISRVFMKRTQERWLNLSLALIVGAITAAPWYLYNLFDLLPFLQLGGLYAGKMEGDPLIGSYESWSYYWQNLVDHQILFPFTLLFIVGLILLLRKKGVRYETVLLLSWIIIPYFIFSNYMNKDIRYTLPYLPAMAVVTALGLATLKSKLNNALVASLALYAVFQFVGLSWGLSNRLPSGLLPPRLSVTVGSSRLSLYAESVHIVSPARPENWQVQTILHDMISAHQANQNPLRLTVLPNAAYFEAHVFVYYALVDRLPVQVQSVTGLLLVEDARERILASDFVVAKSGDQGPEWTVQKAEEFTKQLHEPSSELGRQFKLIGEYELPNGSVAELYQQVQ